MKSTSTTAYSFPKPMTREDIDSWRDLLEPLRPIKKRAWSMEVSGAGEITWTEIHCCPFCGEKLGAEE